MLSSVQMEQLCQMPDELEERRERALLIATLTLKGVTVASGGISTTIYFIYDQLVRYMPRSGRAWPSTILVSDLVGCEHDLNEVETWRLRNVARWCEQYDETNGAN